MQLPAIWLSNFSCSSGNFAGLGNPMARIECHKKLHLCQKVGAMAPLLGPSSAVPDQGRCDVASLVLIYLNIIRLASVTRPHVNVMHQSVESPAHPDPEEQDDPAVLTGPMFNLIKAQRTNSSRESAVDMS